MINAGDKVSVTTAPAIDTAAGRAMTPAPRRIDASVLNSQNSGAPAKRIAA
jgi:hypothetical protein